MAAAVAVAASVAVPAVVVTVVPVFAVVACSFGGGRRSGRDSSNLAVVKHHKPLG